MECYRVTLELGQRKMQNRGGGGRGGALSVLSGGKVPASSPALTCTISVEGDGADC